MTEMPDHLKSQGTTIFVLGLLSLLACQILGPVALIMGNGYIARCHEMGVEPDGLGKAGRILGIIGTVYLALVVVLVVLYFVAIIGLVASGAMR